MILMLIINILPIINVWSIEREEIGQGSPARGRTVKMQNLPEVEFQQVSQHSCIHSLTKGTSFQPSTGQFLVKANKELKLTTNLEKIVKDKNPSSASHLLSLNASRRNSFNQSNLP